MNVIVSMTFFCVLSALVSSVAFPVVLNHGEAYKMAKPAEHSQAKLAAKIGR